MKEGSAAGMAESMTILSVLLRNSRELILGIVERLSCLVSPPTVIIQ